MPRLSLQARPTSLVRAGKLQGQKNGQGKPCTVYPLKGTLVNDAPNSPHTFTLIIQLNCVCAGVRLRVKTLAKIMNSMVMRGVYIHESLFFNHCLVSFFLFTAVVAAFVAAFVAVAAVLVATFVAAAVTFFTVTALVAAAAFGRQIFQKRFGSHLQFIQI